MYVVIETQCYPCKWKVEHTRWPNNDLRNFFVDYTAAVTEAKRRNKATHA